MQNYIKGILAAGAVVGLTIAGYQAVPYTESESAPQASDDCIVTVAAALGEGVEQLSCVKEIVNVGTEQQLAWLCNGAAIGRLSSCLDGIGQAQLPGTATYSVACAHVTVPPVEEGGTASTRWDCSASAVSGE